MIFLKKVTSHISNKTKNHACALLYGLHLHIMQVCKHGPFGWEVHLVFLVNATHH